MTFSTQDVYRLLPFYFAFLFASSSIFWKIKKIEKNNQKIGIISENMQDEKMIAKILEAIV